MDHSDRGTRVPPGLEVEDVGQGPPVVVIPGIQGRWEWMRPAIESLGRHCRVVAYSFCGEPKSGCRMNAGRGLEDLTEQVGWVLDRAGLSKASLCGVSFGGFVAIRYAALHPERVDRLILVSTPSPRWTPNRRVSRYLWAPRLMTPVFVLGSPLRLWPEIAAAHDSWPARIEFGVRHTLRVVTAPFSPTLMARRAELLSGLDLSRDCERILAPTLVITGEDGLDRVVPVGQTREYREVIAGARIETLERTGHIGLVTRPEDFANLVVGHVSRRRPTTPSRPALASD